MRGYDKWKLRDGNPSIIVASCEQCGGEIYLSEAYYKTNLGNVHEECYEEFAECALDAEVVEGLDGLVR